LSRLVLCKQEPATKLKEKGKKDQIIMQTLVDSQGKDIEHSDKVLCMFATLNT